MTAGIEARAVACDLLGAVLTRRRPLDEALANNKAFAGLAPRDRAFARHLTATSLRRLGQIDALIAGLMDRPLKPKLEPLRQILRLGLCQILFLETPPHAAVDTAADVAEATAGAVEEGVEALQDTAKDVAEAVDEAAEAVSEAAVETYEEAVEAVGDAAEAVGDKLSAAWDYVWN